MSDAHGGWTTTGSREVYSNPWIAVREDAVLRPDGGEGIYGVVTMQHPSVFVVAMAAALVATKAGIIFGIGLAFGAFAWFVPDLAVRDKAKVSREDFAYAAVSYLRLVAIASRAGLGLVASLDSAAHKSDSWMFLRIREELRLARWSGETSWDALERLAGRTRVPELKEVADIIRLANDSGASVSDNLLARAASMRDRLLTREQTAANAATSSMGIPLAALAVLFLIAMLVPAAMQLSPG